MGRAKEKAVSETDPVQQVEAAREAFEREFERFARFTSYGASVSLKEAEAEHRALNDLRNRHVGKKSSIAACKKLIGRVPSEDRASFGQLVQQTETTINQLIEDAEQKLKSII